MTCGKRIVAAAGLLLAASGVALGGKASNWPQFRGPGALGVATGALPDRWSATDNVAWKVDIPGRGWSSPIVWGDRVYLTTAVEPGQSEPPRKGLYLGGERPQPLTSEHEWKVSCLDLGSGRVHWERLVHRGRPAGARHLKNTYATETPVTDGERVYAYFGNLGVFCLSKDGRPLWEKRLAAHQTQAGWGTAASPVLYGDRLYIVNDNEEQSCLLALDKRTGREVWRVERDEKSNWATPYVWKNAQRTEIITPGTGKVRAYDLKGKLLWWLSGMSGITIATPYAVDGLLYVTSGFVGSPLRPIYAIRPGASGDISLKPGETANQYIAWCRPLAAPYNPSTLLYDGRLYVLHDFGRLSCYDARTGTPLYEGQRLQGSKGFTVSPWAYNGKVYCLDEDGATFVGRAGDTFELLGTNRLGDDEMCMATPAMAGDHLLIRTAARLYCIRR